MVVQGVGGLVGVIMYNYYVHYQTCIFSSPLFPYRSTAGENEKRPPIVEAGVSPWETQCVLASCQSLALLDGEVVGDPLEKACVTAINWTINKGIVFKC